MEERLDSGQTPPARPLGLTAALFVITLGAYVVVWVHRVYGELRRAGRTALPPLLAAGPLVMPALNALWLLYLGIDLPRALRRLFAQGPRGEQPETEMLSALLILPVFGGLGIALLAGLPVWLAG